MGANKRSDSYLPIYPYTENPIANMKTKEESSTKIKSSVDETPPKDKSDKGKAIKDESTENVVEIKTLENTDTAGVKLVAKKETKEKPKENTAKNKQEDTPSVTQSHLTALANTNKEELEKLAGVKERADNTEYKAKEESNQHPTVKETVPNDMKSEKNKGSKPTTSSSNFYLPSSLKDIKDDNTWLPDIKLGLKTGLLPIAKGKKLSSQSIIHEENEESSPQAHSSTTASLNHENGD